MATIEVKNISKRFGTQIAVDDVTFSVEPGEIFGLLGTQWRRKNHIVAHYFGYL